MIFTVAVLASAALIGAAGARLNRRTGALASWVTGRRCNCPDVCRSVRGHASTSSALRREVQP